MLWFIHMTESDPETDTDSMKIYCQCISVSVNYSAQFHKSLVLFGLDVGLGLGQRQDTMAVIHIV